MPYEQEFIRLQELLEVQLGELKKTYKIKTPGIPTAYQILNSPKVDELLERDKVRATPVQPTKVDPAALKRRFKVAYGIARDDGAYHRDNRDFGNVVQQALDAAEAILKDRSTEAAYAAWCESLRQADKKHQEELRRAQRERKKAEEARKKEEQERRRLEQELAEAQKRIVEAEQVGENQALEDDDTPKPEAPNIWASLLGAVVGGLVARYAENRAREAALDLTGQWQGSDGMLYHMRQQGSSVSIQATMPYSGYPIIEAEGELAAHRMQVRFRSLADRTFGTAVAEVAGDGRSMTATTRNHVTGMTGLLYLQR